LPLNPAWTDAFKQSSKKLRAHKERSDAVPRSGRAQSTEHTWSVATQSSAAGEHRAQSTEHRAQRTDTRSVATQSRAAQSRELGARFFGF